jgi:hypothetical protein
MQPTHIRRVDIEHPVNSQEFLNQKEHEISEQDVSDQIRARGYQNSPLLTLGKNRFSSTNISR